MKKDPKRPESEDTWAHVAEDLFGIDLSESQPEGELVLEEEQLPLPLPKPRASERIANEEAVDKPAKDDSADIVFEEEEYDEIIFEEEEDEVEVPPPKPAPAPARTESREDTRQPPKSVVRPVPQERQEQPDEDEDLGEAKAADRRAKDTYWDALEDWDWGERPVSSVTTTEEDIEEAASVQEREAAKAQQREAAKVEERGEDWESEVQARRKEFLEDEEFGAGVTEEVSPAPPSRPPPQTSRRRRKPTEAEPEADVTRTAAEPSERRAADEGEETGRPKRRRRRRRRPSDKPRATTEAERSELELEPEAETREAEAPEEIDVVWDSAERPPAEEQDGPPKERRRRRRRKPDRPEKQGFESPLVEEAPQELGAEDDLDAEEDLDTDDALEDAAESRASAYRNIPTWEQAISYLLDPSQVGVRKLDVDVPDEDDEGQNPAKPPARRGRRRRSKS